MGILKTALATLAFVCLGMACAAAQDALRIGGPAAAAINSYLDNRSIECPSDPDQKCTLRSATLGIKITYGGFSGELARYAIAFIDTDTGGSGAALDVVVWRAPTGGSFSLVGETPAAGDDPRNVRFVRPKTISYTGTVIRPGDAHASPTGKRRFQILIEGDGIRFRE